MKIIIEDRELDLDLKTIIAKMEWLNKLGWDCFIEGVGDGSRNLIWIKKLKGGK